MKRILITGKDSYIGINLENLLLKEPNKYEVTTIDLRNDEWEKFDFSIFDVVFHVAGIAHTKISKSNSDIYYKVNRDLAFKVAKKSKESSIRQFIFLSSMSVYDSTFKNINLETPTNPTSDYGKSKLQAEELIRSIHDTDFNIAIVRPPMVYGKNCKGNYKRISKLAKKIPLFPLIYNKRSMIHIDNLNEFIRQLIVNNSDGLFFPQNSQYVNTSEMVRIIANLHGNNIILTKIFNPIIRRITTGLVNKIFGDLTYNMKMSEYDWEYRVVSFEDSIRITEEVE